MSIQRLQLAETAAKDKAIELTMNAMSRDLRMLGAGYEEALQARKKLDQSKRFGEAVKERSKTA